MPSPSAPRRASAPRPVSRRERLFGRLAHLSTRYPLLVTGLFALLALLAFLYIRDFPLRTAYLELLPREDPLVEKFRSVQEETASTDVVAVLLTLAVPPSGRAEGEARLVRAAERLIAELRVPETPEFAAASYRVGEGVGVPPELAIFRKLSPGELERLRAIAAELGKAIPSLPTSVPRKFEGTLGPLGMDPEAVERAVADLTRGVRGALATLDGVLAQRGLLTEAAGIVRGVLARDPPPPTGEPLLSRDGTRLVLQVWPTRRPVESLPFNQRVTRLVREAVERSQEELAQLGVTAEVTGSYVTIVEADAAIRRDMTLVTAVCSGVVLVLLFLAFASLPLCVCALLPVLVSALFTMAWAKFAVGGFNLLTMFLPALILGLGIDFSIHILSRYVEERGKGVGVREALGVAVRTKGGACLTAALTTAAVFSCLLLSHSRALWEMGVISGVGILIALGTSVLLTPALVTLVARDRRSDRRRPIVSTGALQPAYRRLLRLRPGVVAVGLLLTAALAYQASRVEFRFVSDDLAPSTPAMKTLDTVVREFGGDVWLSYYFRFFVDRPEEIAPLEEKLLRYPLVHSVASVRRLLPQELLGREESLLDLPVGEARAGIRALGELLEDWEGRLGELEALLVSLSQAELGALAAGQPRLAAALSRGFDELFALLVELEGVDVEKKRAGLRAVAQDLAVVEELVAKVQALPGEEVLVAKILEILPEELRARYATRGTPRRYIVEARLLPTLHEGGNLRRFLEFADSLGVDRIGVPEVTARLETYMRRDFLLSTALALLIIFLLVWRDFPRPWEAALALAPLAMGYVWMLAGMNLLGIAFNFTNIVISPLLIGIGVDSAVHLLHRVEEERAAGGEATVRGAAASALPVALSSLTTMASFGALLAARTPGLRLLGTSALLGLGFTLLWSLTFLPAAVATALEKRKRGE